MNHLLTIDELGADGIDEVMRTADTFAEVNRRPIPKVQALRGKTVVSCFFEDSTRTRLSFETAARRLGADVMTFAAASSSLKKGESLRDTVETLEAIGADAFVVRHKSAGVPAQIARWTDAAGRQRRRRPARAPDPGAARLLHAALAPRRPARQAHPHRRRHQAQPRRALERRRVHRARRQGEAGRAADAAAGRRSTTGRSTSPTTSTARSTTPTSSTCCASSRSGWTRRCCRRCASTPSSTASTPTRAARLKPGALILHPGPMNRGVEIAADVADAPNAVITEQVANGVSVRMAVLFLLLGSRRSQCLRPPRPSSRAAR